MLTAVVKMRSSDAVVWLYLVPWLSPLFILEKALRTTLGYDPTAPSHCLNKLPTEASPRLFGIHESMTTPTTRLSQHFGQRIRNSRWYVLRVAHHCCFSKWNNWYLLECCYGVTLFWRHRHCIMMAYLDMTLFWRQKRISRSSALFYDTDIDY